MGYKIFAIGGEREALELSCDYPSHREGVGRAWFDCGTNKGNLALALVTGWTPPRNNKGAWLCPQCASKIDGKPRSRTTTEAKLVKVGV